MNMGQPSSDFARAAAILGGCLDLKQVPVAVSFTNSIPIGLDKPAPRVPAGCRFWQDAALGPFTTSAVDHRFCAIGVHTHNLRPSPEQQADLKEALGVFEALGYVTQEDLKLIPVLHSQPAHVVYAPLSDAMLPPDVVLLFVNASQTLILAEAAQQVEGHHALAMGRPACAVIPQVMNTGRAALSLGCCGARAYLDVLREDVALFALPGAKLEAYMQRIEALAKANSILSSFHQIRRHDVAGGQSPTVKDSLAALAASR